MGLRGRKTYRLLPGVRVNVTLRGVSTTIGPRTGGMRKTYGYTRGRGKRTHTSISLPFGLSWFKTIWGRWR